MASSVDITAQKAAFTGSRMTEIAMADSIAVITESTIIPKRDRDVSHLRDKASKTEVW